MRRLILILLGAIALVGLLVFVVAPALGQEQGQQGQGQIVIEFPVSDVAYGSEGNWKLRAGPVPGPPAGYECAVSVELENGNSTHPGNDLRVLFGDTVVLVLGNYETESGGRVGAGIGGIIANGEPISLEWRPGSDRITSSGGVVTVACNIIVVDPPPPIDEATTTTGPTSTTTSTLGSTTTVPQATTTEVPPPTLIESGDAGYLGEEDDGHEHEDEGAGLAVLLACGLVGMVLGALIVLTLNAVRYRNQ